MSLFPFSEGEALSIAASRGTPCFAYRLDIAEARFLRLRAALPGRVRLAYAVKANPHPALLSRFAALGAWFDAASGGELERITRAGAAGSRALLGGPGKSAADIELALSLGARLQVDGPEDLGRIEEALDRLGPSGAAPGAAPAVSSGHASAASRGAAAAVPSPARPLPVSVRVHPGAAASGAGGAFAEGNRIIGGAGPSAFGVDEESLGAFLAEAASHPRLRIAGLQVFAASNERDAGRLLASHRAALAIGERLQGELGRPLDLVDLGGGLGIPYAEGQADLDAEALGRGLAELLRESPWFEGELVLEPGRWLAGPCGAYLARVARTKESRGTRFAILEGGANHLLRPLLTGEPFPAAAPGKGGPTARQVLAGPLCTSLDRLGEVELPLLAAGDLVMLGQAGAYGYTEAMGDFLSRPRPEEHWYEGSPS